MHQGTGRASGRIHHAVVEVLLVMAAAAVVVYLIVWQPFANPTKNEPPSQTNKDKADDSPSSPFDQNNVTDGPAADAKVPPGLPIDPWGKRHHFPEIRKPWYVRADDEAHVPAED
jgi:hypothetical protein